MKKILILLSIFFSVNLVAQDNIEMPIPKFDQSFSLITTHVALNMEMIRICDEKEYKFYKILKLKYIDENGQSMEFIGKSKNTKGDIIETPLNLPMNAEGGMLKGELKLICFKEDPNDPSACDVENYLKLKKLSMQKVEPLEGSKVIEISSIDQLKKEIAKSDTEIFVDCYSTYCPPCKILQPIFEKSSMNSTSNKFFKINVDNVKEISQMYQIQGVPTLLIFKKDGELKSKKVGLPQIKEHLQNENLQ